MWVLGIESGLLQQQHVLLNNEVSLHPPNETYFEFVNLNIPSGFYNREDF